ncbi:pca1 [Symbiodinium natans]|uniref:Pca1 protein n=1 Tax=Symbiodinium natans TaxID=878477 RepID=A0A812JML1_9DINO|nr:pca1 [Symbiodinium natans]
MELLRCAAQICCGESPAQPKPGVLGSTAAPVPSVAPPSQVTLTGRRKSLLVGINYFGTQNELHGCVSDVQRMLPLLDQLGFPSNAESRRVMVDTPDWPQQLHPTLANMRQGIAWLTQDAQPGDSLLFHYSGHGGRMPRTDGRSEFHETLCPVDMDAAGMLLDSELFETLVRPLPSGCRLTCILDSCHSGGVLDLPFIFVGTQENLASALAGEAAQMAMSKNWLQDWQAWKDSDDPAMLLSDVASMGMDLWGLWGKYNETRGANEQGFRTDEAENAGIAVGEVVAFTGCASEQTSADVGDVGSQFQPPVQRWGGVAQGHDVEASCEGTWR